MKKLALFSLIFVSSLSSAKTVSDFINEHPELAKNPIIKSSIQQDAIALAGLDAMSNGADGKSLGDATKNLLAEDGYSYARAALRELAGEACGVDGLADVYSLRDKDCQVIIKVDSEID